MERSVLFGERARGVDNLIGIVNIVDAHQIGEGLYPVVLCRSFANAEQENAIELLDRVRTTQTLSRGTRADVDHPADGRLAGGGHALGAFLAASRRRATSCVSRARLS